MRRFGWFLDYYHFAESVIYRNRYRYDAEHEEFIKTVEETRLRRTSILPAGTTLYRAQLGHRTKPFRVFGNKYSEFPIPLASERMTPEPKSAREGRVNPKGIPCLYLADQPDTAMSEVRPWLGAYVSIGHFRTVRDLKLIDCTAEGEVFP